MKPDTNTMSTDHNSDVLKIFGIDSNIIEHYDIFHRKDGVHIILKLINREQRCPVCQTRTTKVVNYIDKKIKHSVVSTSSCFIDYHARRYRCPACNKTFYESNPFTFGTERISSATVYSVLQDLKKPFETFKSVGERYHISTNTVINIFDRYISTPRLPMPSVLSIDEVYVPTDDRNKYLCILFDFETKMIIDGASEYAREINFKRFREIADKVGAVLMVDMAHIAGLVATGLHQSPIPYAHVTTTTTHKTLRGPRGGMIMCSNEVNEKYNFNKAIFPGIQGGPLMHVIAGKAVAFKEALDPSFKDYMKQVVKNADTLANALIEEGFDIVSGGTDNHLMLVDLKKYGLTGKEAEKVLDSVHITCNKNTVPNDPKSPFVTSGLRLGTPAVTTRGLKEDDMKVIAKAIRLTLLDKKLDEANELVLGLTKKYPIYE